MRKRSIYLASPDSLIVRSNGPYKYFASDRLKVENLERRHREPSNLRSIRIHDDCLLQNLRKDPILLRKFQRIDTDVVRAGILREPGRETMVGAVQIVTLAGQLGTFYQRSYTWQRKYKHDRNFSPNHYIQFAR